MSAVIKSSQTHCLLVSRSYAIAALPELDPDERPGTDDIPSLYQSGIVSIAKQSSHPLYVPLSGNTMLRISLLVAA
jgi:hypothetical protein